MKEIEMNINININRISETGFSTFQHFALDAQSQRPLLKNKSSLKTPDILNESFLESINSLHLNSGNNWVKSLFLLYQL